PLGPGGTITPLRALGTLVVLGPLRAIAPRRPVRLIGAAGVVPTIGLVRPIPLIPLVWPTTATAIVVVPLLVGARATPGRLNVGRRDDARAAQVTTAHADVAPAIVVHGSLPHPSNERIRRLPVLEDEPGLRPVRTREDDPRAAVVPIRIVVRIIEHHHPKAHTSVVVGAPGRVTHVGVAVVAQEPGIVVVLLHIIRCDVVIPIGITVGHDALRQIGDGDEGVPVDAEVDAHALAAGVGTVAPVGPGLDAGAILHRRRPDRGTAGLRGHEAEQPDGVQHGASVGEREGGRLHANPTRARKAAKWSRGLMFDR